MMQKGGKKLIRNGKMLNQLIAFVFSVRLHLHKNELDLGSLQPV